ncbi:MAG: tRNA (cmo5U34)-methyltransferase [Cyclobacteriaceae bacterium]|jgi:tRNA (cmo5U34)-methyltransferase
MLVHGYNLKEALMYDDLSKHNKGNRSMHKQFLTDFLQFLKIKPESFLDLGCGTGFFTEIFYDQFPNIGGKLVDASPYMLKFSKQRFMGRNVRKEFINKRFENINWSQIGKVDIIFSALAIHHLDDDQKWELFKNIYENIAPGGVFVLFDLFKTSNDESNQLLEYLACKDCQRRLIEDVGIEMKEFELDQLIEKDREVRNIEGDKESLLEIELAKLNEVGFKNITTIFQEARFAGIVGFK